MKKHYVVVVFHSESLLPQLLFSTFKQPQDHHETQIIHWKKEKHVKGVCLEEKVLVDLLLRCKNKTLLSVVKFA